MTDKSAGSALQRRPIKEVVAELGESWRIPVDALKECIERSDEAVPLLRDVVALAAVAWPNDDDRELLHRGLYVLANARDHATRQPLLRLLKRCPEEVMELFDSGPLKFSRIIESLFDGDREALGALIVDRSMPSVVRSSALMAGTRHVLVNIGWRAWLAELVKDLERDVSGENHIILTTALRYAASIADDDCIAEYEPDLERQQRESGPGGRFRKFDEEDDPATAEMREGTFEGTDDVLRSLGWESGEGSDRSSSRGSGRRVRNSWRGVGRNDPCPCGSGRKAKKCCWALRYGEPGEEG